MFYFFNSKRNSREVKEAYQFLNIEVRVRKVPKEFEEAYKTGFNKDDKRKKNEHYNALSPFNKNFEKIISNM